MEGSLFDVHRAEPSQHPRPTVTAPSLDMKRAESSQQHVRALNTQFARFIFYFISKFIFCVIPTFQFFFNEIYTLFWTFGLAYLVVVVIKHVVFIVLT